MKQTAAIKLKEETLLTEDDKKDKVSFSVAIDSTEPDDKVKMSVTRFGTGTAEDWLRFRRDATKIIQAKKWGTKPEQLLSMYGLLLKGQAETLFTRLTSTGTHDLELVQSALTAMTREYLPIDCAKNTVRYLNQVRKPIEMSIEEFYNRIKTIDSYLPHMPGPLNASLTNDQLVSIVERAVPSEWQMKYCLQQALGTSTTSISTMIHFFKVLEVNERPKIKEESRKKEKYQGRQFKSNGDNSTDEERNTAKGRDWSKSKGKPSRHSKRTNPQGK